MIEAFIECDRCHTRVQTNKATSGYDPTKWGRFMDYTGTEIANLCWDCCQALIKELVRA